MASGELAQETLLQDALGLASKLPGMIPGMGDIGKNMGGLSSMLSQFQKMGMNPESLMKGMMGGMAGAGSSGAQKRPSSARMHSAARKANMSERLKKKIREKASKENNNQSELVEDAWKNLVRRFNQFI